MATLSRSVFLVLAAAVAGCAVPPSAPHIVANVTTFHQIQPNAITGKKLVITARTAEKQQSLEFSAYKNKLAEGFRKNGLVVVDNKNQADWIALVDYSIDDGKTEKDMIPMPEFGQTGGGTTFYSGTTYGSGGSASFNGTGYTPPTYGITGYSAYAVNSTTYTRKLSIDVVERDSLARGGSTKLYEGRAISKGSCGSMPAVFGAISEALLKNWPGATGKGQTIDVPWNGTC